MIRTRSRIVILMCGAACLTACVDTSPAGPQRWSKPGATEASFSEDHDECLAQAKDRPPQINTLANQGAPMSDLIEPQRVYDACMSAKGYRPDVHGFGASEAAAKIPLP